MPNIHLSETTWLMWFFVLGVFFLWKGGFARVRFQYEKQKKIMPNDYYVPDKANLKQKQSISFSESLTKIGKIFFK